MRRAIGSAWPILSELFGLHPWDVERLTYFELRDYMDRAQLIVDSWKGD